MSTMSDHIRNPPTPTTLPTSCMVEKCIQNKCRVCLMSGDIPIFGVKDLSADISEIGGVEVSENDKLPQYICAKCHALLEGATLFRSNVLKSYEILHKVCNYLQNNTDGEPTVTVKVEDASNVVNEIKQEYIDLDTLNSLNDDTDSISTKSSKFKSEADEKSSEEDTTINVEYLEYEDETEDDGSTDLTQLATHINNYEVETKKLENLRVKDEDMFMIIVSDKNNDNNKIASKNPNRNKCVSKKSKEPEELKKQRQSTVTTKNKKNQTCEVCQAVVSKKDYKFHMKIHRHKYKVKSLKQNCLKVACKICNKVIGSSYYKYHLKMHGSETDRAERVRKCHLCDKNVGAYYYANHMKRVHYGQKPTQNKELCKIKNDELTPTIQCIICDREIKEPLYKTHLAKHGKPPKKYVCDKCGMETIYPSSFKTHLLTHGSELKFKCQYCPYRGLHQGLLRVHLRTHTGEYKYKCTECSSKFLCKSNLTQHMRVHRLPTDFKCKACNRCFYLKRSMDRHYKNTHLKLKNHVCDICNKGFGHRDTMLNHQIKVHDRKRLVTKGRMPSYLRPEYNSNKEETKEQQASEPKINKQTEE